MNSVRHREALCKALLILPILLLSPMLAAAQDKKEAPAEAATEVGMTACAGCHSEKADAFKKSWHARKMPAMKKVDAEKTCESCHGPGSLHVAAGGDKTNPGFETVKITAQATNDRCLACHNQKAVMNWKVGEHNQQGLACATCHKIHEAGESSPKPKSEVCLNCHTKKRMEINLPFHHPIAEGKMECADCHNPHGGDFRNLAAESVNETCAKCHAEKLGPFQQEHPPVAENCLICHNPHGSINQGLLKQSMPNLCLGCHKFPHTGTTTGSGTSGTGTKATANALMDHVRCTNCHFAIHGDDSGGWFTNH
jgi:DmsE family decaheme c-type cytochrome